MKIEMRTKRRWLLSVLDAVSAATDERTSDRPGRRAATARAGLVAGQKGFASRLKAATRPLAEASR